jgi:hypothetical protein
MLAPQRLVIPALEIVAAVSIPVFFMTTLVGPTLAGKIRLPGLEITGDIKIFAFTPIGITEAR